MANIISSGAPIQPAHLLPSGNIGHTKTVFNGKAVAKKAKQSGISFKGTTPSRGANFNMGASDGATAASAEEASKVAPGALEALSKI